MTEPIIKKIDCIRLHVADLESGLSFYRDRLGLKMIWRTEQEAGLGLPDDETEIVLHTGKQPPEIDLKVENADQAAIRFQEAGGTVAVPPFDIRIGRCSVVRDPWGNELVLLDMTKGSLVTDDNGHVVGNALPE